MSYLTFKILVIGDESVGKSTIINHYTGNNADVDATIAIDFQSRMISLSVDNDNVELTDNVKIYFWDTSGASRFQGISHSYYLHVIGVIIVIDLYNQKSCNTLTSYINRVIEKNCCTHKHPILVIGNKGNKENKGNKKGNQLSLIKNTFNEDLLRDYPNESIKYIEVDYMSSENENKELAYLNVYSTSASSSEVKRSITSFFQTIYNSFIKPYHYCGANAFHNLKCAGISGTSPYFHMKTPDKNKDNERLKLNIRQIISSSSYENENENEMSDIRKHLRECNRNCQNTAVGCNSNNCSIL